jgi:hypothetical protein
MMNRKKRYYQGVRMAPYDLVKEFLLALLGVTVLVVLLSAFLSSPDVAPLTIKSVARPAPDMYVSTVLSELNGSSAIAGYGPPYNDGTGSVQGFGSFSPQKIIGVHIPINTTQDFVLGPLSQAAEANPALKSDLARFNQASGNQQTAWENAYSKALGKAKVSGTSLTVPACPCGPLPAMMSAMLRLGESGAMDGLLLTTPRYYQTDYTRSLLFLQDDSAVASRAQQLNLTGSQWGVMNETGNYPGQAWLWLYTLLYQIQPYNTVWNPSIDLAAVTTITILSILLILVPWIPGLNRLPKYLKVYRLIWKDYYREQRAQGAASGEAASPGAAAGSEA